MKKYVLFTLVCGFLYITLTSKSAGIAQINGENRTGGGGSPANCAGTGCHPANTSTLNISLILVDLATGNTVSNGKYAPNAFYNVKVHGHIVGSFPSCGFQFTGVQANGNGAGNFVGGSGVHATVVGPYEIVEQNQGLPHTSTSEFEPSFIWRAPPVGSGTITLFATMLAANGDGFSTGDVTNNSFEVFAEGPTAIASIDERTGMKVYPNPVRDEFRFSMAHTSPGRYYLKVFALSGRTVYSRQIELTTAGCEIGIDAAGWAAGSYLLQIVNNGAQRTLPLIKL